MLAGRDRIIDNRPTRDLAARLAGAKEIVEYPEAHHTLEFEPDPERHIADLREWLGRQVDVVQIRNNPEAEEPAALKGMGRSCGRCLCLFLCPRRRILDLSHCCMGTAAIGSWLQPRRPLHRRLPRNSTRGFGGGLVFCFVAWLFRRIGWADRSNPVVAILFGTTYARRLVFLLA